MIFSNPMSTRTVHRALASARRPLAAADAALNRLYTWRFNPLYQSGTLAVVAFLVMLATGLYLLFFYRIGSPYESLARIDAQIWAGRWVRALHRYAADLAVVAAVLHAFRMLVQGRSWGPQALAWVSGWFLLLLFFVCGWTGYVMLWDQQAQLLALEGARLLDALPIFAQPISRTFVGDQPLPSAFFFLNLFLHVALPIGVGLVFWIHLARLARPVLLPPRPLLWATVGLLFAASLFAPAPLGPKADLRRVLGTVDLDWFYAFWLPASRGLAAGEAWLAITVFGLVVCLAPLWSRPRKALRREPSVSPGRLCTGCFQCSRDCPYEAISMVEREDLDLGHPVAHVDPSLCVSCGICSASCAPMAIGPPHESGRDELVQVRAFIGAHAFGPTDVVIIACENGARRAAEYAQDLGAPVFPMSCIGHVHTSVIEYLLRSGVGGVLLASCPPRDCWHREGPKWLGERLYAGREAELRETLDRRRIQVVYTGEGERSVVLRAVAQLRDTVASLERAQGEEEIEVSTECEPEAVEAAS